MEYEVQRTTRHCCQTEREFRPGEVFYSVLLQEGARLVRRDYSAEAWQGPPADAVGWWQSRMLLPASRRAARAPNELLLHLFDQLEGQPAREAFRYVLALLLVRRRVARAEESESDEQGREIMVMYCPRREVTLRAVVAMPDAAQAETIQQELTALLETESDAS